MMFINKKNSGGYMVFCHNCTWYYRNSMENEISGFFLDGEMDNDPISCAKYCCDVGIIHCNNPVCFETKKEDYTHFITGTRTYITKKRKLGCAQLNKNYNCQYYKRKWWKFWLSF